MRRALFLAAMVFLAVPAAKVQDPVEDTKHIKVEFESDQVRVLRYRYEPRENSNMHNHPNNVQILLTDTDNKITTPDGKTTETHGKAGEVRWRPATTHMVENIGAKPFEGILVELKGKPAAAK